MFDKKLAEKIFEKALGYYDMPNGLKPEFAARKAANKFNLEGAEWGKYKSYALKKLSKEIEDRVGAEKEFKEAEDRINMEGMVQNAIERGDYFDGKDEINPIPPQEYKGEVGIGGFR